MQFQVQDLIVQSIIYLNICKKFEISEALNLSDKQGNSLNKMCFQCPLCQQCKPSKKILTPVAAFQNSNEDYLEACRKCTTYREVCFWEFSNRTMSGASSLIDSFQIIYKAIYFCSEKCLWGGGRMQHRVGISYGPPTLPGVIPECRAWNKPWIKSSFFNQKKKWVQLGLLETTFLQLNYNPKSTGIYSSPADMLNKVSESYSTLRYN